ncbi:MAG TPA: bifunctional diaminohydroxyphosphoribosylaminopyrimidine deaminase/5-amino-6-(5-phosphoribosylamino)uracil reductase RibD, partial [Bacteroidia bacterium]|nr:bifunctional diaminohydroxyphosphoribosylaminopyrimidine deaminase/5-amino-6-(5-phosphoribosylamino)uracil reductase RibD [Bacteroidia bacterium]
EIKTTFASSMNTDEKYMKRCLELATKGFGKTAQNPMVGCVIVHDGKIIGEGFHEKFGEAHAEVNAINAVKNKALLPKSKLYVNLEPCSHFGKTPPCADLILKYKIPYVIIGNLDPNKLVKGKGIEKLIKNGCDVKLGILENECRILNKRFFTFHEKKRPFIILKWAQTADGFIDKKRTLNDGQKPLQISNKNSLNLSHKWRSEEQSILIGTNTALLDNPKLTARIKNGKNPIRIVLDKDLRIPKNNFLLDDSTPTFVFTAKQKKDTKKTVFVKIDFNKNILKQTMKELYQQNIISVIVEGGSQLLHSFINENLWDEARIIVSPKKIKSGINAPLFSEKIIFPAKTKKDLLFYFTNNH